MAKGRKNCGFCLGNTNPSITAWLDLVAKSSEIGLDSGQTIMHRMLIIGTNDHAPNADNVLCGFLRPDRRRAPGVHAHGHGKTSSRDAVRSAHGERDDALESADCNGHMRPWPEPGRCLLGAKSYDELGCAPRKPCHAEHLGSRLDPSPKA